MFVVDGRFFPEALSWVDGVLMILAELQGLIDHYLLDKPFPPSIPGDGANDD